MGRIVGKSLVIVESPAKARTLEKFLGKGFQVKASMGHVRDLPSKVRGEDIGVDEENDFAPTYQVLADKKKVISALQRSAKTAEVVYLAADPDREGEAICWHLEQVLREATKAPIHRVMFNEITRQAVRQAVEHPGDIDQHKVDAQQARRVLDRLVGYKISPLLWKKAKFGLSAGRVQTVALRMVVEREREIRAFEKVEYWSITARLEGSGPPAFEAKLIEWKGKKPEIPNEESALSILAGIEGKPFRVRSVEAKERKRNPPPAFTTSKLQQDAARRLGFAVSRTMRLAQNLYEGKELGEGGPVGLITYMRTDSTRIADEALDAVRRHILETYGKENLPDKPRYYRRAKDSQDAHEAIRPTDLSLTPERVARHLAPDELKLYTLIWNRFVACQMRAAIFDTTRVDIEVGDALFRATGSVLRFPGYLAVYQQSENGEEPEDAHEGENPDRLPSLGEREELRSHDVTPHQHFTQPPPRYTEASLVKALEENGIGRPSTYASILNVLQSRDYAKKSKRTFFPTPLGEVLVDPLIASFSDIFDIPYTAEMEKDLDEIEEGRAGWVETVREFHAKFVKDLEKAADEFPNLKKGVPAKELGHLGVPATCPKSSHGLVVKIGKFGPFVACEGYPDCDFTADVLDEENGNGAATDIEVDCPSCGLPMALRRGRWGPFLACSGYPECKTTQKITVREGQVQVKKEEVLEETCPECGKNLAKKHGRYGEYVGCTGYPDCRHVKRETTGVPCPRDDGGEIVARRSRRGRTFYGCSAYPKCDFVAWRKPVARKCPDCGAPYLTESTTKRYGERLICDNKECDYAEVLRSPAELKAAARNA
jgi:DNA topoisomerase-1